MLKIKLLLGLAIISSVFATSIHADIILIQEDFNGATATSLDGITAGGTLAANWDAGTRFNADGSIDGATGNQSAHIQLGSAMNAAKGTVDGLFELSVTLDQQTAGGWYGFGFSQLPTPSNTQHFLGNTQGVGSIILRSSSEIDMWAGNGYSNIGNATGNSFAIDGTNSNPGSQTLTVQVDLRTWDGVSDFGTVNYLDSAGTVLVGGSPNVAGGGSFNYTPTAGTNNPTLQTDPVWESILLSTPNNSVGGFSNLTLTQITAVPEPGSLALLGLGSLVMVARRRKS